MLSKNADPKLTEELTAERERLSGLRSAPLSAWHRDAGVLLSDRIKSYCKHYDLITPFCDDNLRPAGYDLRVGDNYSVAGSEPVSLQPGDELEIPPYQVAIIQTLETLNLPKFVIGRWNIRVKLAYRGLLWVGGAQVDPGWRGKLSCPIYNLSDKPVRLRHGDSLAAIDFVTTTRFAEPESMSFEWDNKWLVFRQYPFLSSGVAKQVGELRESSEESRKRIDNFVMLVFVVISVLFTALGILATQKSAETSILASPVWVAGIALYFALRSNFGTWGVDRGQLPKRPRDIRSQDQPAAPWFPGLGSLWVQMAFGVVLALAVILFHLRQVSVGAEQLHRACADASNAKQIAERNRADLELQIKAIASQSDVRIAALQQEINMLQKAPSRR